MVPGSFNIQSAEQTMKELTGFQTLTQGKVERVVLGEGSQVTVATTIAIMVNGISFVNHLKILGRFADCTHLRSTSSFSYLLILSLICSFTDIYKV